MRSRVRILPAVGVPITLCTAAILLLAGCQPSQPMAVADETCPVCSHVTRVQPLTGLEYTTCICPSCRKVLTVNEDIIPELLRFTGPEVGESVTVCEGCGVILEECTVCREARGR